MTKTCSQCGEAKPLDDFNKDKRRRHGRRSDCRACTNARNRKIYLRDREKRLAYAKARYEANRERLILEMRAYDQANREAQRARSRAWREANREGAARRTREWRAANPETCRGYQQVKRARKLAAPNEKIDPAAVYARDGGLCGICRSATDPDDWHLDHIIPLSRGGHHLYENVQVSHPLCNMSKGAKMPGGAVAAARANGIRDYQLAA